jgi:arsenate reductase
VWLGGGRRKHLGFPDPAAATGSEREKLETFRCVRDDLKREVFAYLRQVEEGEAQEVEFYAP